MATYAIGDVQGCFAELQALLNRIQFDAGKDQLWFAGDIINRGPQSLATIRFIKSLGDNAVMVLGNHDLHLLAVAFGGAALRSSDTLQEILAADDGEELCHWLRHQPLLHYDATLEYAMAHAGIFPGWDLTQAQRCADEVAAQLQSPGYVTFLKNMYGDGPHVWSEQLTGFDRFRFIVNAFTRMRLCGPHNALNLKKKGPPGIAPHHYQPWFKVPGRLTQDVKIIFGHWAALEGRVDGVANVYALDTGCVWGNYLTALRLDDGQYFQVAYGSGR